MSLQLQNLPQASPREALHFYQKWRHQLLRRKAHKRVEFGHVQVKIS